MANRSRRSRTQARFSPSRPSNAPGPGESGIALKFINDFRKEPYFEPTVAASGSFRRLLLDLVPILQHDTKVEALRLLLFGTDLDCATSAANRLALGRELWMSELLDAALQDTRAQTRMAALKGVAKRRGPSYLVPRLVRAANDPDETIRDYAQKLLRSYTVHAEIYRAYWREIGSSEPASKKPKDAHAQTPRGRAKSQHSAPKPLAPAHAAARDEPSRWEWDMTTFNTPKYRRR